MSELLSYISIQSIVTLVFTCVKGRFSCLFAEKKKGLSGTGEAGTLKQ